MKGVAFRTILSALLNNPNGWAPMSFEEDPSFRSLGSVHRSSVLNDETILAAGFYAIHVV